MRIARVLLFVSVVFIIGACSNSSEPVVPVEDTFQFYGESYSYDHSSVSISKTFYLDGSASFAMSIKFWAYEGWDLRQLSFYLWSSGDDYNELLTVGEHRAPGANTSLAGVSIDETSLAFIGTEPLPFTIVWESITTTENSFFGNGHILVEEQIHYVCADSLNSFGGPFGPGTPEYDEYYEASCEPGYYIPEQKLDFVCTDGVLWIDEW